MATVLLVDDEAAQVSALREILDEADYELRSAVSGAEARAFLQDAEVSVDAILLDWVLPDADGVELLGWIKEQPALDGVEVVIQSAEMVPERIEAGIERGAYYYLTKPYDPAQLRAIVKAAVSSCTMKRTLVEQAQAASDALRMLDHGSFLLKTPEDAETLAVRLASAGNDPDKGLGLFELMVNAIEHGNLGITYEDKSRLLEQGRFLDEVQRRLGLPEHRDKRVVVELERDYDQLRIRIRDCGPGFDYRKYLTVDPARLFDTHGRGILMAGNLFELEYVDPGNEVQVTLRFAR